MPTNLGSYARAPAAWLSMLAVLIGGCASTPASVEISDVEEVAAVVTAIDQGRRLVTIRGPQGNEVTFQAGPEVQNLAQVRTGDVVRLSYEQAYLATRTDADEMTASVPVAAAAARTTCAAWRWSSTVPWEKLMRAMSRPASMRRSTMPMLAGPMVATSLVRRVLRAEGAVLMSE